jgi:hypothetical protein
MSESACVHVIYPTAIYLVEDARRVLRLKESTVRREVREGRLRVAKRAGRYYLLGEWLLQWLREGEIGRRAAPHPCCAAGSPCGPLEE